MLRVAAAAGEAVGFHRGVPDGVEKNESVPALWVTLALREALGQALREGVGVGS